PISYNLVVNLDQPLVKKALADRDNSASLVSQMIDLALLANGLLKGEPLSRFVKRSLEVMTTK
ncbi:MAG: hypothetical protein LBR64_00645, partial [Dysgonamonadaceae bacterium]|nr:hypothetical protein [Dysgonamonadaceae bacterium]